MQIFSRFKTIPLLLQLSQQMQILKLGLSLFALKIHQCSLNLFLQSHERWMQEQTRRLLKLSRTRLCQLSFIRRTHQLTEMIMFSNKNQSNYYFSLYSYHIISNFQIQLNIYEIIQVGYLLLSTYLPIIIYSEYQQQFHFSVQLWPQLQICQQKSLNYLLLSFDLGSKGKPDRLRLSSFQSDLYFKYYSILNFLAFFEELDYNAPFLLFFSLSLLLQPQVYHQIFSFSCKLKSFFRKGSLSLSSLESFNQVFPECDYYIEQPSQLSYQSHQDDLILAYLIQHSKVQSYFLAKTTFFFVLILVSTSYTFKISLGKCHMIKWLLLLLCSMSDRISSSFGGSDSLIIIAKEFIFDEWIVLIKQQSFHRTAPARRKTLELLSLNPIQKCSQNYQSTYIQQRSFR